MLKIVWVVEFIGEGWLSPDEEEFSSKAQAEAWAKGPWVEGARALSIRPEVRASIRLPKRSLK